MQPVLIVSCSNFSRLFSNNHNVVDVQKGLDEHLRTPSHIAHTKEITSGEFHTNFGLRRVNSFGRHNVSAQRKVAVRRKRTFYSRSAFE